MTGLPSFEEQWREGVAEVTAVFGELSDPRRRQLRELSDALAETKRAMQGLVARVEASSHCADCGGECCVSGRYHFSRADLLCYLATGEKLFSPRFENGLCPYLAQEGCLMPVEYRPFNCISFNCDRIEALLSEQELILFYRLEQVLVTLYREIRSLFPERAMDGSLLAGTPANP